MNKNLLKIGFWSMVMSLAACSQEEIETANNEQNEIEGVAQAPLSVEDTRPPVRWLLKTMKASLCGGQPVNPSVCMAPA